MGMGDPRKVPKKKLRMKRKVELPELNCNSYHDEDQDQDANEKEKRHQDQDQTIFGGRSSTNLSLPLLSLFELVGLALGLSIN
jgi:hypothetical protein